MTIKSSGSPLAMTDIATELGISATGLSLNDSRVRTLAGKGSGAISFSDLYGKSAASYVGGSDNLTSSRTTGTANIAITINSDGTISTSYTNAAGSTINGTGDKYYSPTDSTVGNRTWISWTTSASSGNLGTGGSQALSSPKTFSYSCALNGTFVIGSITVTFWGNSAMTNQVAQWTFTVDCESSNR